jgi:hypothetical protein
MYFQNEKTLNIEDSLTTENTENTENTEKIILAGDLSPTERKERTENCGSTSSFFTKNKGIKEYINQCSMLNVQCSMLNAQCSMLNVQCSMFNVPCSLYWYD